MIAAAAARPALSQSRRKWIPDGSSTGNETTVLECWTKYQNIVASSGRGRIVNTRTTQFCIFTLQFLIIWQVNPPRIGRITVNTMDSDKLDAPP